jgi:hypothetical protein
MKRRHETKRGAAVLALGVLLAATTAGCFYSREIAHTRRDIEALYPGVRFEREAVVSVGPGTMHGLSRLTGLVPEYYSRLVSGYLDEIEQIKVGVYRTYGLPPLDAVDLPRLHRFEDQGWLMAVKSLEDDTAVWVLYRERHGTVRDLYVLVLTEEELVLARVQGHLNRLLEQVMADYHHFKGLADRDP